MKQLITAVIAGAVQPLVHSLDLLTPDVRDRIGLAIGRLIDACAVAVVLHGVSVVLPW